MSFVKYAARTSLYRAIQPLVHGVRRMRSRGIPLDHRVTKVAVGSQTFHIRGRRWSQSDALAIEQCFVHGQYDFPVGSHGARIRALYDEVVTSGRKPLIVDCGANIGASALWFSARFPEAHIIAVEPAAPNFALLEINCRDRGIELKRMGVAAEDGYAYILDEEGEMGCRVVSSETESPVEMVSMKTLLQEKHAPEYVPFLLKIDIEGGEAGLFAGDCSAINRFPVIVMEPHDWLFPGKGSSVSFFRFHADHQREFCMHSENVASIAPPEEMLRMSEELRSP